MSIKEELEGSSSAYTYLKGLGWFAVYVLAKQFRRTF